MKVNFLVHFILFLTSAQAALAYYCPATRKEWSEWRDRALSNLASPNSLGDFSYRLVDQCKNDPDQKKLFSDPQLVACLDPIRWAASAMKAGQHQLSGITLLTNANISVSPISEYLKPSRLPFPKMLEPPSDLIRSEAMAALRSLKDFDPDKIAKAFDKLKTKYPEMRAVEFKSRFIGGARSIVIVIPGENYDQYIHLDRGLVDLDNTALILAIQKKTPSGQILDPPKSFFNAYTPLFGHVGQDPNPNAFIKLIMHANGLGSGSPDLGRCVGCHRVGGMPVVPRDESLPSRDGFKNISFTTGQSADDVLDWINSRVESTADAKADSVNLEAYGPAMGEMNPASRTDAFIKDCSKGSGLTLSERSIKKIQQAMNCSECHNGKNVGLLNFPVGPLDFVPSVFETMILSGHMPPNENLDKPSRKALVQCLSDEYYGGFKDPKLTRSKLPGTFMRWLGGTSCYGNKPLTPRERASTYDMGTGIISPKADAAK